MEISRVWAMPNADTFSIPPIGDFVQKYLRQSRVSIDPFARNKRWATYTNDLNPLTDAEYHLEALDFLKLIQARNPIIDLAIFDSPYSLEQCKRSYESVGRKVTMRDTQVWGRWTEHKDIINEMMDVGGTFLHFGWHTNGMGLKRGFEIVEILLVAHGSGHNDTICMAERKMQHQNKLFQLGNLDSTGGNPMVNDKQLT